MFDAPSQANAACAQLNASAAAVRSLVAIDIVPAALLAFLNEDTRIRDAFHGQRLMSLLCGATRGSSHIHAQLPLSLIRDTASRTSHCRISNSRQCLACAGWVRIRRRDFGRCPAGLHNWIPVVGESEAAGDAAGGGAQPVPLIAGTCEAGGRQPASRGPAWVRRVTSLRPGYGIQVRAAVVGASRAECDLDAPPVVIKLARRKRQLVDSRDHRISFAPNQELI